ncbi:hypothetical protein M1D34_30470 (plasmid) [Ensifer sp. D2-11]
MALLAALRASDVEQFDELIEDGLGTRADTARELLSRFQSLSSTDREALSSFLRSQGFEIDPTGARILRTGLGGPVTVPENQVVLNRVQPHVQQGLAGGVTRKDTGEAGFRLLFENPLAALGYTLEGVDCHLVKLFRFSDSEDVDLIEYPTPPKFSHPSQFAEMAELYWMALARDVPFANYGSNPITRAAAVDLGENWGFYFNVPEHGELRTRAQNNGVPDTARLFRSFTFGDRLGPYVAQYLVRPVPMGRVTVDPRMRTARMRRDHGGDPVPVEGRDYLTNFEDWLERQQGFVPQRAIGNILNPEFDFVPRLIRSGRDGGEYVHVDIVFQEFLHACFLLLVPPQERTGYEADLTQRVFKELDVDAAALPFAGGLFDPERTFSRTNPYSPFNGRDGLPSKPGSSIQQGFITLGNHDVKSLVSEVARRALLAAWYQKWSVQRRTRPEEFGARIHVHFSRHHLGGEHRGRYTSNWDNGYARQLLERPVLEGKSLLALVAEANAANEGAGGGESFLLPIAFPEGCPMHSAYAAGHATAAGACATLLKAFVGDDRSLRDLYRTTESRGDLEQIFVPAEPQPDGRTLRVANFPEAEWPLMTIGGELNKLASNESLFRNHAGVHWRSDHTYSLLLGQAVAIYFLWDLVNTYSEAFSFELRTFEGYRIRITRGERILESVQVIDGRPEHFPNLEGLYNPVWLR